MKIALVHDYLSQDGGAERVLKAFHEIWPEAPIFVLFHNKKQLTQFQDADVRESFFKRLPFGRKKYQWYLPLMPLATERHNLHEFDVVLSSTSAFAKGVLTRPETLHISYCHTPTRYLWTDTHEYIADLKYNRLIKFFLPRLIHKLRLWDKMSVDRVDTFIANSGTVAHRIQKYYRRYSDIIYPPVDVSSFSISSDIRDYFVTGGRLVTYKRFDLVIHVFNRLGIPLKIFGDGPELEALKGIAKKNISFVGRVSDEEKARLLKHAKAFIHPQVEDLGITPIESMASGRPVIAFGEGGVTETVIPGETGVFFYEQTWESLLDVVLNFDHTTWDSQRIREWSTRFDEVTFKKHILSYVTKQYGVFQQDLMRCQLGVRPYDHRD
ncbi:MAG: Glycosyl transferase group 1 [Candidatus Magasanikbacteria bacterium GW2011_GWD2_43_18]|uniref:Glycosyl transferase group 1 n=1 Tax=Candidatus Magasanikbacteria bacterium GW2011_GWE2_42_7 TaxID=1619052 RepID=A0A0G1BFD5_9BACT|nr:MAG: Glycosyl transferase group 1 [Candidatus Magasanikbacteria bacterium GW2011_GWC2_42_27]KKS71899.1 MAG: Glycosyl transferase group 1 [Candidatus Magasanikbacteria bacterium GW2011_GWE2_42_7]KKT05076.1 MAG: Glycosyl transferase group 1 [Candidatus Magasanikbacteria bacterium GW2011_GWD2_43_18]KKT25238.1 MAG: Glycosyl transferase group 1 [Candidatus Magasanikbacteria bacterium GW2011_GWA2_43_9]HBB38117.1 glycosyltransferase family 4 protein [Candidatus Magasanikbacteria bacterium]